MHYCFLIQVLWLKPEQKISDKRKQHCWWPCLLVLRDGELLLGWCSFNIEEALYFGCLDSSDIVPSTSFKAVCFHLLKLDLWFSCLVHQLSIQLFRLMIRSDLVSSKFTHVLSIYFGTLTETFLSLLLFVIVKISCQYMSIVFIYKNEPAR